MSITIPSNSCGSLSQGDVRGYFEDICNIALQAGNNKETISTLFERAIQRTFTTPESLLGNLPPECRDQIFCSLEGEGLNTISRACREFHDESTGIQYRLINRFYRDERLAELLGTFGISRIDENPSSDQIQQFFKLLVEQVMRIIQYFRPLPLDFNRISPLDICHDAALLKKLLEYVSNAQLISILGGHCKLPEKASQEERVELIASYLKQIGESNTQIDFSEKSLICLSPELFLFENAARIQIFNQPTLVAISDKIGALKKLEWLHIENCGAIRSLPSSIGDLPELKVCKIQVDEIHLDSLKFLVNSPKLNCLAMSFKRRYHTLPKWLSQLVNLKELMFVEALPSMLREFEFPPNLERLSIICSELSSVPPAIFTLKEIRHLDLSGNLLESIPQELIDKLNKLESLNLFCNPIRVFPDSLFKGHSLQQIYISQYVPVNEDIRYRASVGSIEIVQS